MPPSGACTTTTSNRIHWEVTRNIKASFEYCTDPNKRAPPQPDKLGTNDNIWIFGFPEPLRVISDLRPWQQATLDKILLLQKNKDERTIMWLHEPRGGFGKTAFTKYLCHVHSALVVSGKSNDMFYAVAQLVSKGTPPPIVVVDVPRSLDADYISYGGIEKIKDGCFYSGKYEGTMVLYNSPVVLVFANVPPSEEQLTKFSADRWFVRDIRNEMIA